MKKLNLRQKLNNLREYGSFESPKYKAKLVFKDIYGKKRVEYVTFQDKPRGKTIKLDHNIRAKITELKRK